MIKHSVRYDNYAYRLSDVPASAELIAAGWEEGQFLSYNANGELVKATNETLPFMSLSSARRGRNQFVGKTTTATSLMFGPARVATNNFDATQTYTAGAPLYVDANGDLTTVKGAYLVGYVSPGNGDNCVGTDGFLTAIIIPPVPAA